MECVFYPPGRLWVAGLTNGDAPLCPVASWAVHLSIWAASGHSPNVSPHDDERLLRNAPCWSCGNGTYSNTSGQMKQPHLRALNAFQFAVVPDMLFPLLDYETAIGQKTSDE